MAALITEAKPRTLQVSRLRQEEEESWISSEELHTDGSSDEEGRKRSISPFPSTSHHSPPHLHHTHHHHHHHLHSPHHLQPSTVITSTSVKAETRTPSTASEPASQVAPHLTETTRRLSELGLESIPPLQITLETEGTQSASEDTVEQEHIMLWRPKRGSLKFPHIDYSAPEGGQKDSTPSTSSGGGDRAPMKDVSEEQKDDT